MTTQWLRFGLGKDKGIDWKNDLLSLGNIMIWVKVTTLLSIWATLSPKTYSPTAYN